MFVFFIFAKYPQNGDLKCKSEWLGASRYWAKVVRVAGSLEGGGHKVQPKFNFIVILQQGRKFILF